MKRSEMQDLIYKTLINDVDIRYDGAKCLAAKLLRVIEEAGMAPPNLSDDKIVAIQSVYNYSVNFPYRTWDEEFERHPELVKFHNNTKKVKK